jgi:thiol-disulfide isomerase/thioredoxin
MKIYALFIISLSLLSNLLSQNQCQLIITNNSNVEFSLSHHPYESIDATHSIADTTFFLPYEDLIYITNDSYVVLIFTDKDSIVTIDINTDGFSVISENQAFHNFINEYHVIYSNKIKKMEGYYDDIDQFESSLYNLFNNTIFQFFNNYSLYSNFSLSSIDYFKKLLKYHYLESMSSYILNHNMVDVIVNEDTLGSASLPFNSSIPRGFLDDELLLNSLNDSLFYNNFYFQEYIYNYTIIKAIILSQYNKNSVEQNYLVSKSVFDFSQSHLPDEIFKYLLLKYMSHCHNIIQFNTIDYFTSMLIYYQYPQSFIDAILVYDDSNKESRESIITDPIKYEFYLEDVNGNISSIDTFLGKVLYIDIWASWCGPCRKQFPYAKKLKEQFSRRDLRKIEFMYISIDNDYDKWKKALIDFNIKGSHFISPANKLDGAGSYFEVAGIPRYIIINKDGSIADYNAKRPNDDDLLKELLELIKM